MSAIYFPACLLLLMLLTRLFLSLMAKWRPHSIFADSEKSNHIFRTVCLILITIFLIDIIITAIGIMRHT